jgi:hypothetical protein
MHKEIGGYLELERFSGTLLHEEALRLGSGRACLSYLIEQKKIRKLLLPDLICDVVEQVCERYGVTMCRYPVGPDLRPAELPAEIGDWLYLVNYYGQLTREEIRAYAERFPNLIVDNAQAYFDQPIEGVDTLYTCRKFFGVADGGFLYTDAVEADLPTDESRERMGFVLGRFERPAGEYFAEASGNNDNLPAEPRRMSCLTENLLRAVDYERAKAARTKNYRLLHEALGKYNQLRVRHVDGPYAYPLMLENGPEIRRELIRQKIYVPTLWPNVLRDQQEASAAYQLAGWILPLPCDQRYGPEEMAVIIEATERCLRVDQEKLS